MTTPLPPTDLPSADEPLPGEAELAVLYRQLPQNEPSPALDAAVLRAAAAAFAQSDDSTLSERRRRPREPDDWVDRTRATQAIPSVDNAKRRAHTPRWLITLGSAASLVLVAGLAWQLRESSPPPSVSTAQKAAFRTEATAAARAYPESGRLTAAPSPASPPAAQPADQQTDQQATMQAAAAKKMQQGGALRSAQRQHSAKATAALPPTAELAAPAPAPAKVAAAPPVPAAPPAPAQEVAANAASGLLGTPADAPSTVKSAPPAAAPVAMNQTASDKDTTQQPGNTPAQELDKVQQLFAQGQHGQALQRLRAFHKAHPQWPLSPSLQARLQEP